MIPKGEYKAETRQSLCGRLQLLSNVADLKSDKPAVQAIGYDSTAIKRVYRATVQAEAYGLTHGVVEGDRLRAALADVHNCLDPGTWEATAAAFMAPFWFTDCRSVRDNLSKSVTCRLTDKRLQIEFYYLRKNLWHPKGEAVGNPALCDDMLEHATGSIRWIDSDVMISDPMTKTMEPVTLVEAMDTNVWDIAKPIEAIQKKRAKQSTSRKCQKTWERIDFQATHVVGVDDSSPDMSLDCCRTTKDASTGDIIDGGCGRNKASCTASCLRPRAISERYSTT